MNRHSRPEDGTAQLVDPPCFGEKGIVFYIRDRDTHCCPTAPAALGKGAGSAYQHDRHSHYSSISSLSGRIVAYWHPPHSPGGGLARDPSPSSARRADNCSVLRFPAPLDGYVAGIIWCAGSYQSPPPVYRSTANSATSAAR